MSSVGDRLAAATGAFNTQSTGLLYTARSSSTAPAPSPTPAPAPAPSPSPSPSPSPAPAPACSAPAWNEQIRYMPGDVVTRLGKAYTATQQSATSWNVDSPPEWTPNLWSVTSTCSAPAPAPTPAPAPAPAPAPSPSPSPAPAPSCSAPEWDTTTRYMPGDRVMRLGTLYVASQASATAWNVDSPPEWTPNYWDKGTC
jgi:chitodextrinase